MPLLWGFLTSEASAARVLGYTDLHLPSAICIWKVDVTVHKAS